MAMTKAERKAEIVASEITPEVGSIWESRDKRDNGRQVLIVNVSEGGTYLDVRRVVRGTREVVSDRIIGHTTTVFVKRWKRITQ